MKVLHLISSFSHPLYIELLRALQESVSEQFVYYPYRKKAKVNVEFLETERISYFQNRILNTWTKLIYAYKILIQYRDIKKNVKIDSYDMIHAHTLFSDGGLAFFLKRKYGIPYVISVRSTDVNTFFKYKPWLVPFAKVILKNSDSVICLSPTIKETIERKIKVKKKIETIPNGIVADYHCNGNAKIVEKRAPRIKLLYVGQFRSLKNVDLIIDFIKKNSKYELAIVGGGGDADQLITELIKKNDRVSYYGAISDIKILRNIYRQHDIFIMPSRPETFGLVYMEAMSQGTPILYSQGTGIDGYFENGEVGYSISSVTNQKWETKINMILDDYEAISFRCQSRSSSFIWSEVAHKIYNHYK